MKILFTGGGTAGHINPALAIANYICEKNPDAEIKFIGTKQGLEVSLVPKNGYPLDTVKIHGFSGKSLKTIKSLLELPGAIRASKKIIKQFKPDIVIGTGGYVCGPVMYAAAKLKIPTLVHESNAFPGITVRLLSKYVDITAVGIEEAKNYLPDAKNVMFTGSPIRTSILTEDSFSARRKLNLDDRPFIVIFGGSLGARDFNAAAADWICSVCESGKYRILMATGKNNQFDTVTDRIKSHGLDPDKLDGIEIREYIYDMDIAMNAADLVMSRAGASTLAELTAIGKPAILVPSPYVADNHQEHNARAIERGGGARVIPEKDLTAESIEKTVSDIVFDPKKLADMKKSSLKMGVPDSTEIIYREVLKLTS